MLHPYEAVSSHLDVIPVHGHPASGGEGHGDNSWCDVSEVKIKTMLLIASLVL